MEVETIMDRRREFRQCYASLPQWEARSVSLQDDAAQIEVFELILDDSVARMMAS